MKKAIRLEPGTPVPFEPRAIQFESTLMTDDFLQQPAHGHIPEGISSTLVSAVGSLADDLAIEFAKNPEYPNAKLHLYPLSYENHFGVVDFMLAWGSHTELPHPREDLIPQYFGRIGLTMARLRRQMLVTETLDAHGILGDMYEAGNGLKVRVYSQGNRPGAIIRSTIDYTPRDFQSATHVIGAIMDANLLRFHAGVTYTPSNKRMRNYTYPDDQRNATRYIDRRIS